MADLGAGGGAPVGVATVEKLGLTAGRRKIRTSAAVLANHCCALGRVRESSLRRRGAEIVFQQHRSEERSR